MDNMQTVDKELPNQSGNNWVLKLLTGTHQGAEMVLANKAYSLGCSTDNDIVITEGSMSNKTLALDVSEGGLSFKVIKEGEKQHCEEDEDSVTVEPYKVYKVGLLKFCFGKTGTTWTEIVDTEDQLVEPENSSSDVHNGKGRHVSSRNHYHKIFSHFLLFVAVTLVTSFFYNDSLDAGIVSSEPMQEVMLAFEQLDLKHVEVLAPNSEDNAGLWSFFGYVERSGELQGLERLISRFGIKAKMTIRAMDDIRRSTETLLGQFKHVGMRVTVIDEPGAIRVSGVSSDLARWEKTKIRLLSDIPGLKKIDDQVQSHEGRATQLQKWIEKAGLEEQLTINAVNGRLNITSQIMLKDNLAWADIKKRFKEMYGESLSLVVMNQVRPNLLIRGVSAGTIPYVVLGNGQKYAVGSHIHDGYFIAQIDHGEILLKRGAEVLSYKIGQ